MFNLDTVAGEMSMSRSNSGGGNFIASNSINQKEMELVKNGEFMGSDFFQRSPGLARYRSAPSSFLATLLDSPADNSSSGDESDALFSAIWNGPRDLNQKQSDDSQFHLKHETGADSEARPRLNVFSNGLNSRETPVIVGAPVGSYSESQVQVRLNESNLIRQNSSPAGFFNACNLNFSPGASSSPRIMPSIPENGFEIREPEADPYSHETWSESMINGLNRNHDANLMNQCVEPSLVHHLSLPKTSNAKREPQKFKFLQFQPEVVPCQIRAKRGCATHPRSIAERIRRTRISERMKKLQELFPNMDKHTSIADMLDLAVEYIKDLQTQVQTLTETKANCICSSKTN